MALFERIDRDLMEARRRRDQAALATLGLLKSEVVNAAKREPAAPAAAPGDELVLRVVRQEVRRREEAGQAYAAAGRKEAAARERAEADLLRGFLPAPMGDEELERELRAVIAELRAAGPRDLGPVMKAAGARLAGRAEGARLAGRAEGARVAVLARSLLAG